MVMTKSRWIIILIKNDNPMTGLFSVLILTLLTVTKVETGLIFLLLLFIIHCTHKNEV